MTKVPDIKAIKLIMNDWFQDTEIGGTIEEDELGTVYVKNADGSLYAIMDKSVYVDILNENEKEKEINNEITQTNER
jgi:hypothetical protein